MKSQLENVGLRLDAKTVRMLDELCEKTYRNRQDVLRAAVSMLFAGGVSGAARLLSGVAPEPPSAQDEESAAKRLRAARERTPGRSDKGSA